MKKRLVVFVALLLVSYLGCVAGAQSFPLTQMRTPEKSETTFKGEDDVSSLKESKFFSNLVTIKAVRSGAKSVTSVCKRGQLIPAQGDKTQTSYSFSRHWFPIWGLGCDQGASSAFFNDGGAVSGANQAKFLYNPVQSTNQISVDLFTLAVPGTELILSGTGSTSTSQSGSASGGAASTQSVSTVVSKLIQGGDFNVSAPLPIASFKGGSSKNTLDLRVSPNLGLSINTNTSTSSTGLPTEIQANNFAGNIPVELAFLSRSVPLLKWQISGYVDGQESAEILGSQLASTIGTSRVFSLTQVAFGILVGKFRIGGQYFIGPQQAFETVTSTGSTPAKGTVSGIHLDIGVSK